MAEAFVITATCKNEERDFNASFAPFGFSYRIEVIVDDQTVFFEPDEERNYRAYMPPASGQPLPDPLWIAAIAAALEKAFR